jgi:transmembrane sensor
LQVRSVKVDEATAWTEGLLIFDGTPLAEVIAEFNRQNRKRLVLRGAADLAEIKITGAFPANGAERITRFLHERFDVTVHESDDQIVLTRE